MYASLKSEMMKLLTIRSTYVVSTIGLLLLGFICFYALGYQGISTRHSLFMQAVIDGSSITAVFLGIIAVLNVTHEYRYNTITHTLSSSNSRTKVFLSKLIILSSFALMFFIISSLLAILLVWLGKLVADSPVPPQEFYYWETIWRSVYYLLAWTLLGSLFGFLFKHVVGAIAVMFIVPATVEGLLEIVLKENTKYLPYTALEQVHTGSALSPAKGALVFGAYLVTGYIIAWILFLRRDAS